jgi:hypothetical protein
MRIAVAVLAAILAFPLASPAATPFSTDASDLWYNPAEAGWGMNLAQQGDIAFLTLYVYGADGKPTWYVASSLQASVTGTTITYTGDLFSFTGSPFNAAWDPNALRNTKVGSVTFTMVGGTQGSLTYTVNGVRVAKPVVRQTWRENNATGSYIGFLGGSCATSINGPEESMTISINQAFPIFQMNTTGFSGVSCGYSGMYSQDGRLGSVDGTFNCSNGKSGTFSIDAMEAGVDGFVARLTTKVSTCTYSSRFAAMRRN